MFILSNNCSFFQHSVGIGRMRYEQRPLQEKSIERVSSPEQLNDYVRVSSPGVWAVLAAVLILLAGAFVWGILGRLETTVPAVVISRDGAAVCCYDTAYGAEVGAGMPVRVGGEELSRIPVEAGRSVTSDRAESGGFLEKILARIAAL